MIIIISGSVGTGKTSIANALSKKLNCDLIHLNDLADNYKLEDIYDLETFDFDLDKLLDEIEKKIMDYINLGKDLILEGHFAHFINPELVSYLFVINRDLEDLRKVYIERGYNEQKIKDNLEVESFNLCFYEGLENDYQENGVVSIGFEGDIDENIFEEGIGFIFSINNCGSLEDIVNEIIKKIGK